MATLLITDTSFLGHDTGPYHPEQPARLESVLDGLSQPMFADLQRADAQPVAQVDIARVHPGEYFDLLAAAIPAAGLKNIDADTVVSPGSAAAMTRAAGAVAQAVDAVAADRRAQCLLRGPPARATMRSPAVPWAFA